MIYRKLSFIKNQIELNELEEELRDRFGTLPVVVQRLLKLRAFTLDCNMLGIERLEIGTRNCTIHFASFISYQPEPIIDLLSDQTFELSFPSSHSLKISAKNKTTMEIYDYIQQKVKELKNKKEILLSESI